MFDEVSLTGIMLQHFQLVILTVEIFHFDFISWAVKVLNPDLICDIEI